MQQQSIFALTCLQWGENNLQASEQMIIDNIIEWEN